MHKRLKGISILNGDVMDAPLQNGIADLEKWFSADIAMSKDRCMQPLCANDNNCRKSFIKLQMR